eukprot:scaffold9176_cov129-Cylindrotheca_fusiformis.AAC.6
MVEDKAAGLNGLNVLSIRPFRQSLASFVPATVHGDYVGRVNGNKFCYKGSVRRVVERVVG